MRVRKKQSLKWTPEEDAILFEHKEIAGAQLREYLPDRTTNSINLRRRTLGIAVQYPTRSPKMRFEDLVERPLTEETAYHVRKDYAAKRKLGYTHEKAIKWLVEANSRTEEAIIDLLENPVHDADVAAWERKARYTL